MDWVIFFGIVAVAVPVLVIAQRRGWIELRGVERPSGSVGVFAVADELFAPTRTESAAELEAQTRIGAPAPVAGDPLRPGSALAGAAPAHSPVHIPVHIPVAPFPLPAPAPALRISPASAELPASATVLAPEDLPAPTVGAIPSAVPAVAPRRRPEPLLTGAVRIQLDLPSPPTRPVGRHAA
ncbi:hypothetical protein FJ656_19955 [Schumannella luteola]|uniref:Uncharacterized protein n=1 Tax=Schumannella luteola TaxID=472059 RepID=A0A852Y9A5_9MICO|nr:hypothetical protein [Schumannella luteola]NYG97801.1 hypothetical protein [Schumannella luteola]TPX02936.1 hypothetical protein FJ656_19955 [Schumannella luteola]